MHAYTNLIESLAPQLKLYGIINFPSTNDFPASLELPSLRFFCLKYQRHHNHTPVFGFLQNICENTPHLEVFMAEYLPEYLQEFVGNINFSGLAQK